MIFEARTPAVRSALHRKYTSSFRAFRLLETHPWNSFKNPGEKPFPICLWTLLPQRNVNGNKIKCKPTTDQSMHTDSHYITVPAVHEGAPVSADGGAVPDTRSSPPLHRPGNRAPPGQSCQVQVRSRTNSVCICF